MSRCYEVIKPGKGKAFRVFRDHCAEHGFRELGVETSFGELIFCSTRTDISDAEWLDILERHSIMVAREGTRLLGYIYYCRRYLPGQWPPYEVVGYEIWTDAALTRPQARNVERYLRKRCKALVRDC